MDVFVIVVTTGKVMYQGESSSVFSIIGDRSRQQRSVCSLKGVYLFRSPIVNLLEGTEVGKASEKVFTAANFVLWFVVGLL